MPSVFILFLPPTLLSIYTTRELRRLDTTMRGSPPTLHCSILTYLV